MKNAPIPTHIKRDPEGRRLLVTWSDGHESDYSYRYLRGYCPCAACQGHDGMEVVYKPPVSPVDLDGIELVGNYAVTLRFSDRHATGIYRFAFLREICPCPLCKTKGEDSPSPSSD
jgi:DUF971 family protein